METLKNNGIDTGRYFTLVVNETIQAGTKINISIEENEVVAKEILESGYVRNTRLHRRFVCSQYFRMLNSDGGFHDYLNRNYDYMYQFKMMLEEVRVLKEIAKRDTATFQERSKFFTCDVVSKVLGDYRKDMIKYVEGLPKKKCKGQPYVYVNGFGNVFVTDLQTRVYDPIDAAINKCQTCNTCDKMYDALVIFRNRMVKLPYYTKKSKTWVDAFQREGAFYTLKNLIMFHDVKLATNSGMYETQESSMVALNEFVNHYEGYKMHAILKKTIEENNFDFRRSIEAHK